MFVKCENQAVVSVINTGVTRDNGMGDLVRNIWFETALWDIKLKVVHFRGKGNCCADLLSRWLDNNTARLSVFVSNPVRCMVDSYM